MTTKIEWVRNPDGTQGKSWNPVTGCTKVSEGCRNCYAERIHNRFSKKPFSEVTLNPERLNIPIHWKQPQTIFICSMSDLFHEDVPDEFIDQVFAVIAMTPQHRYIILTKRSERMFKWFSYDEHFRGRVDRVGEACADTFKVHENDMYETPVDVWPLPNLIPGTSVSNQHDADNNIPWLLKTPAVCRMVSFEPALAPVSFARWMHPQEEETAHIPGISIDWLAMGSETGPGARSMSYFWGRSAKDQCVAAGIPFFYKRGVNDLYEITKMPVLDGHVWDQMPEILK